jgi:hypothetical protein
MVKVKKYVRSEESMLKKWRICAKIRQNIPKVF